MIMISMKSFSVDPLQQACSLSASHRIEHVACDDPFSKGVDCFLGNAEGAPVSTNTI
jgi:hypothetical protein